MPSEAATPALVFVGFLMMSQVTKIDWEDVEEGLPAFLTMVLMPFTFSITIGIGAGFVSYVVLKVARGKARRVHPLHVARDRHSSSSTSSRVCSSASSVADPASSAWETWTSHGVFAM